MEVEGWHKDTIIERPHKWLLKTEATHSQVAIAKQKWNLQRIRDEKSLLETLCSCFSVYRQSPQSTKGKNAFNQTFFQYNACAVWEAGC